MCIAVTSAPATIQIDAPTQEVFADAARLAVLLPQTGDGPYASKKTDASINVVRVNLRGAQPSRGRLS